MMSYEWQFSHSLKWARHSRLLAFQLNFLDVFELLKHCSCYDLFQWCPMSEQSSELSIFISCNKRLIFACLHYSSCFVALYALPGQAQFGWESVLLSYYVLKNKTAQEFKLARFAHVIVPYTLRSFGHCSCCNLLQWRPMSDQSSEFSIFISCNELVVSACLHYGSRSMACITLLEQARFDWRSVLSL